MNISQDYLLITAALALLISLGLAWLGSLIIYARIAWLKSRFPATHQLIRAHIDYLLMTALLVITFFLCLHLEIALPDSIILLLCFGALYNPFGFILLAIKPELANPKTPLEKARVLIGFVPATVGYVYAMIRVLQVLL